MRVLVMGGTEFVSSSLAKYCISKGYMVDIFTRGLRTVQYEGVNKHLIGDRKASEDLLRNLEGEKYDYVFDISAYTKEDVEKLVTVLNKESLKRYVFCSSGAVYIPSSEVVTEDFVRGENVNWGAYGLDKKEAEDYLFHIYESTGFPITIFRPTYIYGEGNNLYRESYFFDRINKGLDIPVPAGNVNTQFIHIEDLVQVFESSVHTPKTVGQAYNVTHPRIVNWQALIGTAMKVVDKKVNTKEIDSIKIKIHEREYFPFRNVSYALDIKKSERDGLHVPQIDLEEGIERAYKWYSQTDSKIKDDRMNKMELVLSLTGE